MDLPYQVCNWFPIHRSCNSCPHIQIDLRDKNVTAGLTSPALCRRHSRLHMTEEPVGRDDVLRTESTNYSGIANVPGHPDNSLLEPQPDLRLIAFKIKHRLHSSVVIRPNIDAVGCLE